MSYYSNIKNFKNEMKNSKSKTLIEKGVLSRKRYSKKHKMKQKGLERGYESSRTNLDKISSDVSFGYASASLNADKDAKGDKDLVLEEEIKNLDANTLRVMKKLGFDVDEVLKRKNIAKITDMGKNENFNFNKKNRLSYQPYKSKGKGGQRGSLKKGYDRKQKKSFKESKKKFSKGKFQDLELSIGKVNQNFSFKENSAMKANRNKYWRSVTPKPLKSKNINKFKGDKGKSKRRQSSREKEAYFKSAKDKLRRVSKSKKKSSHKKRNTLENSSLFTRKGKLEAAYLNKRSKSRAKNKLRDILKKNNDRGKKKRIKKGDTSGDASSLLETYNKDSNKTQEWKDSLRANISDNSTVFSPSGTKSKKERSKSRSKSRSRSKKNKNVDPNYSNLHSLKSELLKKKLGASLNRTPTPNKNNSTSTKNPVKIFLDKKTLSKKKKSKNSPKNSKSYKDIYDRNSSKKTIERDSSLKKAFLKDKMESFGTTYNQNYNKTVVNNYPDNPNNNKVNVNVNLNLNFKSTQNLKEKEKPSFYDQRAPRRNLRSELISFKEDANIVLDREIVEIEEEKPKHKEINGKQGMRVTAPEGGGGLEANGDIEYDDYFKIKNIEDYPELVKTVDLEFLAQCGNMLKEMDVDLEAGESPYQKIRLYTDFAQDQKFSYLSKMFKFKQAAFLFSKIIKIERWSVILLFYFCVHYDEPESFFREKKLGLKLQELIKEVFRNHNMLVNWVKMVNKRYNIGWVLNDNNMIYSDVGFDVVRLVIEIKSCCRVITGIINNM